MLFFSFSSIGAGIGIGLGWRIDSLALVGVLGFAFFLLGQFRYGRLSACISHALLTGYFAYLVANPWMEWTITELFPLDSIKMALLINGIHLFHGGIYCLFAIAFWAVRKISTNGWMLSPALWLIAEAVYPGLYPMRQGCLLLGTETLIQSTSIFGVPVATLQMFAIAMLLPMIWYAFRARRPGIPQPVARRWVVGILLLTLANACFGFYRTGQLDSQYADFQGERLRVGILQGDTEYSHFHIDLIERSHKLNDQCDLLLWPECSLGSYNRAHTDFSKLEDTLIRDEYVGDDIGRSRTPAVICWRPDHRGISTRTKRQWNRNSFRRSWWIPTKK